MDDIEAVRGIDSNDRGISAGDNGRGGSGGGNGIGNGGQAGDTNSDLYATVGDKVVQQRVMPGRKYRVINLQTAVYSRPWSERKGSESPATIDHSLHRFLFSKLNNSCDLVVSLLLLFLSLMLLFARRRRWQ